MTGSRLADCVPDTVRGPGEPACPLPEGGGTFAAMAEAAMADYDYYDNDNDGGGTDTEADADARAAMEAKARGRSTSHVPAQSKVTDALSLTHQPPVCCGRCGCRVSLA